MIAKVIGKVDGQEVIYERASGDMWNVTVPVDLDGMYAIEVAAYDEAGNMAFCTKMMLIVDPATLCVKLVPLDYVTDVIPEEYSAIVQTDEYLVEAVYPCHHGRGCCCHE